MYECHITIEPVFDERLAQAKVLAGLVEFKVASLYMKRDREATELRSENDTFMTGHDQDFDNIQERMGDLVALLRLNGFNVWRYKIEQILVDSKYQGDTLGLL